MSKKKIVFRRLLLTCLILLAGFFPAATAQGKPLANPPRPVLKSASELDYPPFALVRPDGSADGFSVDLLKAVSMAVGLEVDLTVGPWHELKQELADGRLDVLPLVAYSQERDKVYDFTVPYFRMHGDIFVRRGEDAIDSIADLRNRKIMVMREDSAHEYLVREKLGGNLVLTDSFEEALTMLAAGQNDAVVAQELVGLQLIKKLGLANIVAIHSAKATSLAHSSNKLLPGFEQEFGLAVRAGDAELLAHLNEGLALVIANGTFARLQEKWFAPLLPAPPVPAGLIAKYVIFTLLPILLILALGGVWFLRREVAHKTRSLQGEIEKQKQFEEKLARSHQEWAAAMDASEDAIYLLDINRQLLTANKVFYRMTESTPEKAIGSHIERIVHPQGEAIPCPVCRAQQEKHDAVIVMEPDHPDNPTPNPIEVTVKMVRDDLEQPVSIFMRLHDLSRQREVENILRKSRDEWEKTFDAMSDIITIQDKDMRIVRANKAARDLFGVKPGELDGKHCYEVFRGIDQPCAQCPELETLGDCSAHSGTIKHERLGKVFHVSSSPILEVNGDIKYLVHVAKDITEQKKLEEELFQSHKMEAIGTLAGGIAHDFNNILSAIIGYSELTLMELPENSPSRDSVIQIYKAGDRAKELVKQILSFSRKDKQKLVLFAPSSIIKEALKLMRASLPATIAIKEEIAPHCGKILADPTNLHQILVNLCTNALHAIENEKGEIRVTLAQQQLTSEDIVGQISVEPGVFVVLTVSDTGCGMDQRTAARIFEPYFTTKDPGKGTGMGLSVVHGIMQSYGGMIKVASEPGQGATFNLYFPAIENGMVGNVEKKVGFPESLPRGNERILVVDDEEAIVKIEQVLLESLGYKVTSKISSVEALEEFRQNPADFDLILTDQTMPVMTGVDLAKEITGLKPGIPIILCTGYSAMVTEEEAKEIGIRHFASKPVDVKELAVMVRQALDNN